MKQKLTKFLLLAIMMIMGVTSAWAEDVAYTVTFKDSGTNSDNGTARTATADIISSGADYMTVASGASKIYQAKQGYGIKDGSSSAKGSITFNTTADGKVKPTKIVVNACYYSDAKDVNVYINGGSAQSLGINSTSLADYEITMDGNTDLTSIKFESSNNKGLSTSQV